MDGNEKIICPGCDKETVKGEKCTLCGFPIEGFSDYEAWSDALDKKRKKKADEDRKKKEKEAEEARIKAATLAPKKKSLFRHLGGK